MRRARYGIKPRYGSNSRCNKVDNTTIIFEKLDLNMSIVRCFQKYHNLSLKTQIGYFLKKYGGYVVAKKVIKGLQNVS